MITNRKTGLLAFLAIVLILALSACSQPDESGSSTAQVRVSGTAQSASGRSTASAEVVFASGSVCLAGEDITARLRPLQPGTAGGANDVEFGADIPVASGLVSYSVSPNRGFVFDEWKIPRSSRSELKGDYPDSWWAVLVEIQNAIASDSQTIYINPEYIRYIRPAFERGYYFDPQAQEDGDGSASRPFGRIDSLIDALKSQNSRQYDDDELTIKMRNGQAAALDLSSLGTGYYDDESEIELKLIGGYDEKWNLSGERTIIPSIVFPDNSAGSIEELEIELRNIGLKELDYSMLSRSDDDFEIGFRNCSAGILKNASGNVVNALVVEELDASSSNVVFVNSSAPYEADSEYYHSIVRNAGSYSVKGRNNIVLSDVTAAGGTDNLYLDSGSWKWDEYKTEDPNLVSRIITAVPLSEDFSLGAAQDDADDLLEEDIEGRQRYLSDDDDDRYDRSQRDPDYRDIRVSYGPYEYQFFDD